MSNRGFGSGGLNSIRNNQYSNSNPKIKNIVLHHKLWGRIEKDQQLQTKNAEAAMTRLAAIAATTAGIPPPQKKAEKNTKTKASKPSNVSTGSNTKSKASKPQTTTTTTRSKATTVGDVPVSNRARTRFKNYGSWDSGVYFSHS